LGFDKDGDPLSELATKGASSKVMKIFIKAILKHA
jgi:hypothetical protein